jgi:hypothetical protein
MKSEDGGPLLAGCGNENRREWNETSREEAVRASNVTVELQGDYCIPESRAGTVKARFVGKLVADAEEWMLAVVVHPAKMVVHRLRTAWCRR